MMKMIIKRLDNCNDDISIDKLLEGKYDDKDWNWNVSIN